MGNKIRPTAARLGTTAIVAECDSFAAPHQKPARRSGQNGGRSILSRIGDLSGSRGMLRASAKFALGQVVRHRVHPFRGVIFDVDPAFNNTNEWWGVDPGG